ncbi:Metallo-dependent phosphatase-like protein [Blyttiomyces helicus]|uniref:Metallo-dependent phosphatase-like protein n=1 Tax=Blyttiomyces helicus TaxID=388810 RepID=A0A4P9WI62_9FUNG|nr:Metallo-dependent phosphatase-like protein [Blyttiomyces helicus]|eukprot:RKO92541.1 Metallo-dependent phosphatase-like protein [Blyttiomyces helicus]
MRIAVEGCCHGELDRIYAALKHLERVENITIDLLLVCGDFQPVRNMGDLSVLACPDRYRSLGTFHQYYDGSKVAPFPTLFVGGNHEASNYLWELYHGGWAAPNIYFLGMAGVINFGGLRIGGLSGIYKQQHYEQGYPESQPYNDNEARSIYHVRKYNIHRIAQIRDPIDIIMTHDWPRGIAHHGNTRQLIARKPFLSGEINSNTLGSYPSEYLLKKLRPDFWFAAHLHVKFAAIYRHDNATAELTKFLSLDKCLPNRDFLQVLDFPEATGPLVFSYDEEWLAIIRASHEYLTLSKVQKRLPDDETARA